MDLDKKDIFSVLYNYYMSLLKQACVVNIQKTFT